jgi:hypothetical protein
MDSMDEASLSKKDNPDEEMINFLEGKLEQIERQLKQSQF